MQDQMPCIEIVAVPTGPYPVKVRRALVGLRLPFGRDPSDTPLGDRYPVVAQNVLEILQYYNRPAWAILYVWLKRHPTKTMFFNTKSCNPVTDTPSLTEKTAPPRFTYSR